MLRSLTAPLIVAMAAAGCAAPGTPGSGAGATYVPIIDTGAVGVDPDRYRADLAACQQLAAGTSNPMGDVILGALVGAAFGAATASTLAPQAGLNKQMANYGALVGTSSAGAASTVKAQRVVVNCMAGRGYRTLDGGNIVVVQQATPSAGAYPAPGQQQFAGPAPATVPTLAGVAPAPKAKEPPIGQESHQIERMPEAKACNAIPRAVLAAKGPGFETYTVACSNGDSLAVRCEMGACRVLR